MKQRWRRILPGLWAGLLLCIALVAAPATWVLFEVARTRGVPMAFGHWSTLGRIDRPDLLALDTGCVWGGQLSAVRIDGGRREWVQVACEQAQVPG